MNILTFLWYVFVSLMVVLILWGSASFAQEEKKPVFIGFDGAYRQRHQ